MTVASVLNVKGRDVVTIGPDASLMDAAALLGTKKVGAVVVVNDALKILGILSERDIVRVVGESGAGALDRSVRDVMTKAVKVCSENDTILSVMQKMSSGRFRHLPVETDGKLSGIISIGDVVKRRIEDVEREAEEIKAYIATAGPAKKRVRRGPPSRRQERRACAGFPTRAPGWLRIRCRWLLRRGGNR